MTHFYVVCDCIINLNSSLCVSTELWPQPCEPAEMKPTLKCLGWNHAGGAHAIFARLFLTCILLHIWYRISKEFYVQETTRNEK